MSGVARMLRPEVEAALRDAEPMLKLCGASMFYNSRHKSFVVMMRRGDDIRIGQLAANDPDEALQNLPAHLRSMMESLQDSNVRMVQVSLEDDTLPNARNF